MRILTFFWSWILSYAFVVSRSQDLRHPAFCQSILAFKSTSFPTKPPDSPFLPWIWDAVYDPNRQVVEIISVSRHACKVNITKWQVITRLHPEFRDQLAHGDTKNILATSGEEHRFDFVGARRPKQGILGKTVICVYYAMDGRVIHKLQSHVVYSAKAWADIGPLLIRCPVPTSLRHPDSFLPRFDRIAIEREEPAVITTMQKDGSSSIMRWKNRTLPLPFCSVPYLSNRSRSSQDHNNWMYKLSICTTAQRPDKRHLIEWIEYHLLFGFEHFFIYDTGIQDEAVSRDHSRGKHIEGMKLASILGDYENEGIVTLVPWPYQNCIKGMASGRSIYYGENKSFTPPRRITQTGALSSCYSRFRHTSQFMASLDIDEFIAWNNTSERQNELLGSRTFVGYIESMLSVQKEKGAILIPSIMMKFCNIINGKQQYSNYVRSNNYEGSTLRLHKYIWGEPGPPHEGKLVMTCSRVGMFHIHSVSMLDKHQFLLDSNILGVNITNTLDKGNELASVSSRKLSHKNKSRKKRREKKEKGMAIRWRRSDGDRHIQQAELVLLHYKKPAHMTRSIFGGHDLKLLLNESFRTTQDKYCYNSNDSSYPPTDLLTYYVGDEVISQVRKKYIQRLEKMTKS